MRYTKNKFLILGGDSKLGNELKINFRKNKFNFISTTRKKNKVNKNNIYFDFDHYKKFVIPKEITLVYICASITSIEKCEKNKKYTNNINVNITCKLIDKFLKLDIHVIYFSTNLVFRGNNIHHSHVSKYFPQNQYAKQKILVENFLKKQNKKNYSIIRVGKIIFKKDTLFIKWIENIKKNKMFSVVINKFISPIYVTDAIKAIKVITKTKKCGIYQISAFDYISYEEIANLMLKKLKKGSNLIKFIELKNVDNVILKSNIPNLKKIKSNYAIKKLFVDNKISKM